MTLVVQSENRYSEWNRSACCLPPEKNQRPHKRNGQSEENFFKKSSPLYVDPPFFLSKIKRGKNTAGFLLDELELRLDTGL